MVNAVEKNCIIKILKKGSDVYPKGSYQISSPHEDYGSFKSENEALALGI